MRKSHTNAYIALAIVSIFWGTTYLASSVGVRYIHGMMLAGLRQSSAGFLIIGFFLLKGHKLPEKIVLSKLFVIGLLMLCGSNGLFTWAMQYIPSGLGAIIAATVPIWITLFSYFLVQRTRLSLQLIIGMILGFGGVAGIFYNYLSSLVNPDFQFGIFLSFCACIFWALGSVLTAKWALNVNYLYGAGFQMFFSGVVMLIIATLFMGQHLDAGSFTIELWESLLYLVLVGSVLSYSAYVFALNNLPPAQASVYAYINPIVAVLLGWLLLHEKLTWLMGLCSLVTVGGVFLVNNAFNKSKQAYLAAAKQ
ncbi:EamA family transporter [Chitinophaga nivalis]|uniref:EamA family transporter n=1 Tax=Chitinophaga nivalis TaxID=2991709 RepID=A0ABT3IPG4_9BACT|nr:EamA family transporter [Chitinophaga nivalis]MCW3464454.1 EamA family transporter [Chitinophaga nivalis]MCW3485855.1 EamA family transporter [Chitinophaga nivalis]